MAETHTHKEAVAPPATQVTMCFYINPTPHVLLREVDVRVTSLNTRQHYVSNKQLKCACYLHIEPLTLN